MADTVEGLGRLFHSQKPAERRARQAGVDLSRTGQKLLWHVVTEAPIRISDLARQVGMSDALVSRQISSLEAQGLAERRPSAEDGRVAFVEPTSKGRSVSRRLRTAGDDIFQEQMSNWSPADLADLADHLERLLNDLRTGPPTRP